MTLRLQTGPRRHCLRAPILVGLACLALVRGSQAAEDEPAPEGLSEEELAGLESAEFETVVIKAKRLESGEQTTAFGETLEVKEAATRVTTVSEVLSDAVGIQVRRLGGLGSYGAASIRGSTPSQVPVYLDGVLLNGGGFSVVDLGGLAIDSLERIEVYRGFTPVALGTAGIGGALHLKTRSFEEGRTELAVSAGSFNSFKLFGLHGQKLPWADSKVMAALGLERSAGDFDYLNRVTLFNPDDDSIQPRSNNDHRSLSALLKADGNAGPWRLTLAENFFIKEQGVAGIERVETEHVRLGTTRSTLTARAVRSLAEDVELGLDASWLYLHEDFEDTFDFHGELGLGRQHLLATTHAVGLGGDLQALVADGHLLAARLQGRWERFETEERVLDLPSGPKDRLSLDLAVQHEWNAVEGLFLQPTVRLQYLYGRYGGGPQPGGVGVMAPKTTDDLLWQATLGVRWEAVAGLTLQANGGRYVRAPDIAELFGDRGTVVGNPDLEPEVGYNADAGAIWLLTKRGPLDLLRLEAVWFGSWVEDIIVQVQNSQDTVRSENVDGAEILGAELSARLEAYDLLSLSANYTYLHAINQSESTYHKGNRLPGRPVHEVFAKLALQHRAERWGVKAWFDVDYAGRNFFTPANFEEVALARLLFGAGLRLNHPDTGLSLTVEVKNLLDTFVLKDERGYRRPLMDFEGFPLPGRTVMATLHWRH